MSEILSPSRLLPATILVTTVTLGIKVFTLANAIPSLSEWRAGTDQVLELAGATWTISKAQAAPSQSPASPVIPASPQADSAAPAIPTQLPPILQTIPLQQPVSAQQPIPGQQAGTQPLGAPPTGTAPVGSAPVGSLPAQAPAAPAEADVVQPAPFRRGELEEREQLLADREATLAAANKRLTERLAELQAIQARLETLESERKTQDEANWAGLVKLYEGMRPRDAAVIFNALDKNVLLEILDRMKAARAAPVLALMDPESARQVTMDLAAKRTRLTSVVN